MKRVENSIVIVCNFIKVTVDNTRSRVTRRFARWVWVSFYGIPRGKHKLKKSNRDHRHRRLRDPVHFFFFFLSSFFLGKFRRRAREFSRREVIFKKNLRTGRHICIYDIFFAKRSYVRLLHNFFRKIPIDQVSFFFVFSSINVIGYIHSFFRFFFTEKIKFITSLVPSEQNGVNLKKNKWRNCNRLARNEILLASFRARKLEACLQIASCSFASRGLFLDKKRGS